LLGQVYFLPESSRDILRTRSDALRGGCPRPSRRARRRRSPAGSRRTPTAVSIRLGAA